MANIRSGLTMARVRETDAADPLSLRQTDVQVNRAVPTRGTFLEGTIDLLIFSYLFWNFSLRAGSRLVVKDSVIRICVALIRERFSDPAGIVRPVQ